MKSESLEVWVSVQAEGSARDTSTWSVVLSLALTTRVANKLEPGRGA